MIKSRFQLILEQAFPWMCAHAYSVQFVGLRVTGSHARIRGKAWHSAPPRCGAGGRRSRTGCGTRRPRSRRGCRSCRSHGLNRRPGAPARGAPRRRRSARSRCTTPAAACLPHAHHVGISHKGYCSLMMHLHAAQHQLAHASAICMQWIGRDAWCKVLICSHCTNL